MAYRLQIKDSNNQSTITVPRKLVKSKNWEHGEELEWEINDKGRLELREAEE